MISFDLTYLPFKHDKPQLVDDDVENYVIIRAQITLGNTRTKAADFLVVKKHKDKCFKLDPHQNTWFKPYISSAFSLS